MQQCVTAFDTLVLVLYCVACTVTKTLHKAETHNGGCIVFFNEPVGCLNTRDTCCRYCSSRVVYRSTEDYF